MRFAIHGDEAIVDHRFTKVQEAFGRIEGATVIGAKVAGGEVHTIENPAERVQAGVPNLELVQMGKWYGGEAGGHIGFSPAAPLTAGDAIRLRDLLRGALAEHGLDYSAALIPTGPRSFINVVLVVFDTSDEEQTRSAFAVSKDARPEGGGARYGEYRAHIDFMDLCAQAYDFNDYAGRRLAETIKDALDPNGILMPGKQGIWPKRDAGGVVPIRRAGIARPLRPPRPLRARARLAGANTEDDAMSVLTVAGRQPDERQRRRRRSPTRSAMSGCVMPRTRCACVTSSRPIAISRISCGVS